MPKCKFILSCLGLFFIVSVQAQDVAQDEASTLEGYLKQAQYSNPQLKAFEARYQAAMERIPLASALPDPVFSVTHFVEAVQTRTGPQENVFALSQRIPWFGKLSSREDIASAEAEALWYAYQNQQLMLARVVAVGYYEYAYVGKAIELTEQSFNLLAKLEPIVEEKVRAGGDINALLRLKVEMGKVEDQLATLRQRRVAQSARIRQLLALDSTLFMPWPDWEAPAIEVMDGPSLAMAIEENNPELEMLQRKISSAEARTRTGAYGELPRYYPGF